MTIDAAIQKTAAVASDIEQPFRALMKVLEKHGLTKVDDVLPILACAKLGLASACFYSDGIKEPATPDAYDKTGMRVELKSVKDTKQFKPTKKYRGIQTSGASPFAFFGGVHAQLNYNSAKSKDKIKVYAGWRHFHFIHDMGNILTIGEVNGKEVVRQLLDVLDDKQKQRKNGKNPHDNFNNVKVFFKKEDLVFVEPRILA